MWSQLEIEAEQAKVTAPVEVLEDIKPIELPTTNVEAEEEIVIVQASFRIKKNNTEKLAQKLKQDFGVAFLGVNNE